MTRRRDSGYAMIAAIMGVAVFGYIAFEAIAQNRGVLAEVRGEAEQAKLAAACNAGIYMAISGLATADPTQRWTIDGRLRVASFDGMNLAITVEDERGKIPLNGIIEEEAHSLFQYAGATGRGGLLVAHRQSHLVAASRAQQEKTCNSASCAQLIAARAARTFLRVQGQV